MEKMRTTRDSEVENIEQRITDELVVDIYKRLPGSAVKGGFIIIVVAAVMWTQEIQALIIGWTIAMIMALILAELNVKAFNKKHKSHAVAKEWKLRLLLPNAATGLLWGAAILAFYHDAIVEKQIFLITMAIALGIGGVLRAMYYLPHIYVYTVPIMSSLVILFVSEATYSYYVLSGLMVLSILFTVSFSKKLNNMMRSELRHRYQADALTRKAEQATLAKSRFLAAASHDLRQPLHALSLFVDVLKDSKSESERADLFPRLEQSVSALSKLFDALLDVSKLDAKVVKPEYSHFDLAEMLNLLADEFSTAAKNKNLSLKVHSRPSIVMSDRLLLERILRNLISNAIRYTEKGGILLSARIRDGRVLLQVWDTGMGIPQESQDEVFVEFQQLHNAHRDRSQGLGLGLALVKRLCQLLKLPLMLNSQLGKGSVFSISLPSGDASKLVSKTVSTAPLSWELNGRRILVIDDEQDILHGMQTLLTKWGCDVITAESLADAVQQLNRRSIVPELVLSDLRLRDNKTGIEAIDQLREIFGEAIPGILITGDTSQEKIKEAKQSAYEVLQKPVQPMHLRSLIQHYLPETNSLVQTTGTTQ